MDKELLLQGVWDEASGKKIEREKPETKRDTIYLNVTIQIMKKSG
jgi:hypothetical protein